MPPRSRSGADAEQTAPDEPNTTTAAKAEEGDKPGPVEAKDSGTEYLNVSGGPLVYTKDGHQVDAGGWTPAVTLDDVGRAARKRGYLATKSEL